MLYDEILYRFRMEFEERKRNSKDFKEEIKDCYALCNDTLNQLRRAVVEHGFEDEDDEIRFFKEIKVEPLSFLMYYAEVSSYMANCPKNHQHDGLKYVKRQIARVDDFLVKHIEFLIYMESKDSHFDPYYFTREYLRNNLNMHRYPYLKDEEFDTDKDYLLAKIRGWGMYVAYLKREQNILNNKMGGTGTIPMENQLKFTGTPIQRVELYSALEAAGVFNNGTATITDIARGLKPVMGGNEYEVYKKRNELRNRKDQTIFLDLLKRALRKRFDDDDAL